MSGCASKAASTISGIPGGDVEDVHISNVQFFVNGGGTKEQSDIRPPEKENAYPEPTMFGALPSYGFYIRHAKGITFSDIKIRTTQKDYRPAFALDDVKDVAFRFLDIQKLENIPLFQLKKTQDFFLFQSPPYPDKKISKPIDEQF